MTQIEPYIGGGLATFSGAGRIARQTGRELALLDARTIAVSTSPVTS